MITRFEQFLNENRSVAPATYRPIYVIAEEVSKDWKNVNYAAAPYLSAMSSLQTMTDSYGMDSASSIIAYFLSNASSWKGETAKKIKAELNAMLKGKPVPVS